MALANPVLPERYVPWPSLNRALLGRGGASEVWRVRDQDLGVLVALKVLRREGARFQARLEREAALSARILHPKVVGVHDIGRTPQGHSYIAFALASDGSMLDLGSRPLPWPDLKEMLVARGPGRLPRTRDPPPRRQAQQPVAPSPATHRQAGALARRPGRRSGPLRR